MCPWLESHSAFPCGRSLFGRRDTAPTAALLRRRERILRRPFLAVAFDLEIFADLILRPHRIIERKWDRVMADDDHRLHFTCGGAEGVVHAVDIPRRVARAENHTLGEIRRVEHRFVLRGETIKPGVIPVRRRAIRSRRSGRTAWRAPALVAVCAMLIAASTSGAGEHDRRGGDLSKEFAAGRRGF